MESTFSTSTSSSTLFTISRALNRHFISKSPSLLLPIQRLLSHPLTSFPSPCNPSSLRALSVVLPLFRHRLRCASHSAPSFSTSGSGLFDGDGGCGGGCGGDGDGSEGGDAKSNFAAGSAEGVPQLSPDVIILDVEGMSCGGCAASVKKILESEPHVSSASVNLTTETAIVWPVSEAKVVSNWKKQLGEDLAKHLTNCGFKSNLRVAGEGSIDGDISM